jgi:hypothetical protein
MSTPCLWRLPVRGESALAVRQFPLKDGPRSGAVELLFSKIFIATVSDGFCLLPNSGVSNRRQSRDATVVRPIA